ncbi:hypothetical protein FHS31_000803 [Sphingomonas vulcanisoli]|uniref:Tail fiber domain-containing protein n=1 Tax=Sphingomonas vulcanisoli TaxID=1658060 RepID=A0ABX0TNV3_9SPHN|nr:hypothetical protein [Sphingomonas vulcanisoli]NIJ07207.1 hypothetical protein [Sphingomonas vulcanisoli]
MRLYRYRGGWCGTQADARDQAGKQFEQIEVPTDKDGLIHFLNIEHDKVRTLEDRIADLKQPAPLVSIEEAEAGALGVEGFVPADLMRLTDIEEFIQLADHRQLATVIENAVLRLRELQKECDRARCEADRVLA